MRAVLALVLLWASTASAGLRVYSDQTIAYPQFNEMDKGKGIFVAVENPRLGVDLTMAAAIASWFLHDNFVYIADGISDVWDSNLEAVLNNEYWYGDCDDFAFTAALALTQGGIPKKNIFLATVTSYLQSIKNMKHHRNHPKASRANHMIVLFYVAGNWRIIDNGTLGIPLASTLFTGESDSTYFPQGIINMGNYGPDTDNDTEAGFVRFWFD